MGRRAGCRAPAVLLILTVLGACGGAPPPERLRDLLAPGQAEGFHLLLVTLDTVRQDRLGCYGYDPAGTPRMDALAAGGILFEEAVTSVPVTLPAHASILTGLDPPRHGVRDNGRYRLPDQCRTLAESLREHAYQTAAFLGSFVLDRRFGLAQGFETYDFQVAPEGHRPTMADFNERPAGDVTAAAATWLSARDPARPFFLWVHYFDAHLPYRTPLLEQEEWARRPYDAEIATVDRALGSLLDELDRLGLRRKTVVVVVGDHGEALGDRGEATHGMLLQGSTLRVPLLVSCPGLVDRGVRLGRELVGVVDLRPTLEDLLGLPLPADLDGRSLLRAGGEEDRALYIETFAPLHLAGWSPLVGLWTRDRMLVRAPEPELYDLSRDPGESRNLHPDAPPELAELESRLTRRLQAAPEVSGASRALTGEEQERLEALGYISIDATRDDAERPDPKQMLPLLKESSRAERLYQEGSYQEAALTARRVLRRCPRCRPAIRVLAFSYQKLGLPDRALELLRDSVAENPDPFLVRSLAQALILQKNLAEAEDVLDLYQELEPEDGRVPLLRGDIRHRQGRLREARELFRAAGELDPNRVGPESKERLARLEG